MGLADRLMQDRRVQLAVKMLRIPRAINGVLGLLDMTRRIAGTDLVYRLRFSDTLVLARGIFQGAEYAAITQDAAQIRTFVDLGCNVGLFPLYLCGLKGNTDVEGILVDANPAVVHEARENMRINGLAGRVHVVHGVADVGSGGEPRDFFIAQNSMSSTLDGDMLGSRYGAKHITVPVIDVLRELDERIGADATLDLLKLDIEGAELDFLADNDRLLARCPRVILEFHKPKITLALCKEFFAQRGYELVEANDPADQKGGIAYFRRP